jgi:hypothetical protein
MDAVIVVLLIVAALCFLGAALGVATRVNLVAAGLLAWVLAVLIPAIAAL